ncbi:NFX1-type zinc finger-containing protein 1-like [Ruditapes philippinarum]|uniref:NFX1-type zinc finger-containing protein 1-like n=1 Tax=Ruditapes philippinarum TaxID=129788 RepID=UPI00295B8B63|nr:NFX1-type zinc finger-containing protein 1-like [Ruditapes philippinarum]
MDFFLQMKDEDRIHEQATFRQSIVDMFSIMKEMDSFEKCRLSKTEFKGVKAILTSVIEYLKENTNDVIDDEVVDAFREFTEKSDRLTKCEKRVHNDMQDSGVVDVPPKKCRDIQTSSNNDAVQCLLSSTMDKVDTGNSQQGSTLSDSTEPECKHILDCGHKCQAKCHMPHTEVCDIDVEKTFPCGHIGNVKCYKKDSAMCQEPCGGILACEHPCTGTCAECFQGRLHKPCEYQCKRILVCDHECTNKCNLCLPCTRICENRCQHSKCIKRCGELCVPCKEKCTWNCEHLQCGKLCSEPCDRARCDQPCKKLLACGHPCIGLCGEPCPTDCRVCNEQTVTEIFFGNEDEPDAMFVLLEDCRAKCIIESNAMDNYMDQKNNDGKIKLKECPKCKTPIRKSNRYRHIINETLLDIEKVKEKKLSDKGLVKELENKILQALLEVQDKTIAQSVERKIRAMKELKSENTLVALLNQLSLLKAILKLAKEWKDQVQREHLKDDLETALEFLQRFQYWVMQDRSFMTEEELSDAKLEISRSYDLKKLLSYKQQATDIGQDIDSSLQAKISEAESVLKGSRKYEQQVRSTVESCLKELKDALPQSGLGVSEEEKIMIVKAMNFKQKGHWCKCPNGK